MKNRHFIYFGLLLPMLIFSMGAVQAQEKTSVDVYVEDLEDYQSYIYDVDEVRLHGAANCTEHEWLAGNYNFIANSQVLTIDRNNGCSGTLIYRGQGYMGTDTITCGRVCFEIFLGSNFLHVSIDTLQQYENYFCNSYDGVVLYVPEGCNDFYFQCGGYWSEQSPVIVSHSTQGRWYFSSNCPTMPSRSWKFGFSFNPPTEPWGEDEMEMCSSTTRLFGQGINYADYTYLWTTGETTFYIDIHEPGDYGVTVTDACGNTVSDQVSVVQNHPLHEPYLPDTIYFCEGDTVVLDPGDGFIYYSWNVYIDDYWYYLNNNDSTLTVIEPGRYLVYIQDEYFCYHAVETQVMYLPTQSVDQSAPMVTVDTLTMSGNNLLCWNDDNPFIDEVKIYREGLTNQWDLVGSVDYHDKHFIDAVSSNERTYRYKLAAVDICGVEAEEGRSYQTMNAAYLGPGVNGGYWVQWTPYKISDINAAVRYELYSVDNLDDFNASIVDEPVLYDQLFGTYYVDLPQGIQDSLFFVRAYVKPLYGGGTVMSNFVRNWELLGVDDGIAAEAGFKVYPNPNNGTFIVEGKGRLTITNLLGQHILAKDLDGKETMILPRGIYFVKLSDVVQKIVVE